MVGAVEAGVSVSAIRGITGADGPGRSRQSSLKAYSSNTHPHSLVRARIHSLVYWYISRVPLSLGDRQGRCVCSTLPRCFPGKRAPGDGSCRLLEAGSTLLRAATRVSPHAPGKYEGRRPQTPPLSIGGSLPGRALLLDLRAQSNRGAEGSWPPCP